MGTTRKLENGITIEESSKIERTVIIRIPQPLLEQTIRDLYDQAIRQLHVRGSLNGAIVEVKDSLTGADIDDGIEVTATSVEWKDGG